MTINPCVSLPSNIFYSHASAFWSAGPTNILWSGA